MIISTRCCAGLAPTEVLPTAIVCICAYICRQRQVNLQLKAAELVNHDFHECLKLAFNP